MPPPTNCHPSADELIAFAQGALDDARSAVVEVHVFRCEPCASVVATAPNDDFIGQIRQSRHSLLGDDEDAQKRPAERGTVPVSSATVAAPVPARKGDSPRPFSETVGWSSDRDGLEQLPRGLREHPRYEFKKHLATGAMGDVYLALDRTSSKLVAVKVLKPEVAGKAGRKSRFFQEADIAIRLRHPNIAQILHHAVAPSGERSGAGAAETVFFAMEYVIGENLWQLVSERGPLPVAQAAEQVRQIALGLQCAHHLGIVHRDIKPHNVMIERQTGFVKILDFGLGRLVDEQRSGTRLTKEGEVLGTLGYLSPEQAANSREADARSDIYSLGCTFFFLLTGFPPFRGRNAVEVLNKHLTATPPAIRTLRPDVPADIAALLDRMLAKNPSARPQSLQEVAVALTAGVPPSGGNPQAKARTPMGWGAADKRRPSTLLRFAFSPAVVLPVVTLLISLIWLLISTFR